MEKDVGAHGSVPQRAVDDNRSSVMDTATSLSESGELVLPGGGEDDELMY
jgi:flagellar motor switch protein FliG